MNAASPSLVADHPENSDLAAETQTMRVDLAAAWIGLLLVLTEAAV